MDLPGGFIASIREQDKIEAVVASVGFDDLLDVTLPHTLTQVDAAYVVTSMTDAKTVQVCRKHGAVPIQTDAFGTSEGRFLKGQGLNLGLIRMQYHGWRVALDADIILPPHFRRVVVNHETLDVQCLYGADRVNLVGPESWGRARAAQWGVQDQVHTGLPIGPRLVTPAHGYIPIGYFQMWHSKGQKMYPSTAGGAGLDDVAFALQWPRSHRRLLPSLIVYQVCVAEPVSAENWDGVRRHPRVPTTDGVSEEAE